MSSPVTTPLGAQDDFGVLREVEGRVLWLSSAITHHANRVPEDSAVHELCRQTARRLRRSEPVRHVPAAVPVDIGRTPTGTATTQAALGRVLMDLTRAAPEVAARVVTVSPDVSSSTNLGGWV
ncbi:MAG: hypothetical protein JF598_11625, partial [Streptomyces sp.]|nr:hypothetical protein [Streptomyces sp.]